jgi:cytochrome c oxidase cbb3-type subunit 3
MKITKISISTSVLILFSNIGFAGTFISSDALVNLIFITSFAVIAVLIIIILQLLKLSKVLFMTQEEKDYQKEFDSQPFWDKIFNLNPKSMEKKLLLEHDFDGIRELDNPTPPWFNFLFYGTIFFAISYLGYYHVLGTGLFQDQEYEQEVAMAEKQRAEIMAKFTASINAENVTLLTEPKAIAEGSAIYSKYCVACHGSEGQGGVGPNLTDNYWIHGADVKDVFKVITEGVPNKGMISWKKQLNPLQIQQVASFIATLRGTNPPNPKEPQGILIQQ